jgi:2,3-bisphosphoglycerate-independent phosphoglycerate mutase
MEGMDLQIERIHKAVMAAGGIMVITADHGNADDMFEHAKDGSVKYKENGDPQAKTAHSLNPVPCIICDGSYNGEYSKALNTGLGISSIAATCINLLGFETPEGYDKSIIALK